MKRSRKGKAAILKSWEAQAIYENFNTPQDKLIWQILRFTGERISAVLQLKIENVYYKPKKSIPFPEITFPAATRKAAPDGSKQTRQVPVLRDLLTELKNFSPPTRTEYIFPSQRDAMKPISRGVYDRKFRKVVETANLTSRGFSLHSTRRGLITKLHEAGYSLAIIQQITGHKDLNALRKYIEIDAEAASNAIENLDL